MRMFVFCLAVLTLVCEPRAGLAAGPSGRYTMSPVEEGMLRFDTETGSVSLCAKMVGEWVCAPVHDTHLGLQREVDRLRAENGALRAERDRLKAAARRAEGEPAPKKQDRLRVEREKIGPSDETIDEMMTVLEKMVRRFQDMIKSLEAAPPETQKRL